MQSLTEDVWEFQQRVGEYQKIEYYAMFKTTFFGKSLLLDFAASISDWVSRHCHSMANQQSQRMGCLTKMNFSLKGY